MSLRSDWLYLECIEIVEKAGIEAKEKEKEFLKTYFDPYNANGSKTIYYISIFRLKRGWPIFLVRYFIAKAIKKDFENAKHLEILVKFHKIFAKKMLFDAIKAYCKISD